MALIVVTGPVIQAGQSLSDPLNVGVTQGFDVMRLIMPDAWDAANITFQLSPDGTKFYELIEADDASSVMIACRAGCMVVGSKLRDIRSIFHIKIRSGTIKNPIIQTAQRTFKMVGLRTDYARAEE